MTARIGIIPAVSLAGLLVGCSTSGPSDTTQPAPDPPTITGSPASTAPPAGSGPTPHTVRIAATLVDRLEAPWSVVPLQDDALLVSERDSGRIIRIDRLTGARSTVVTIDDVASDGEGGLMGLAVAGDAGFAMYTADDGNRVVRFRIEGNRWHEDRVLLSGIPGASVHDGGRIAIGPDGHLYVATGEAGRAELSQDLGSPAGKILRMTLDGAVPDDNPFPDSNVYSYGHRNVQGLAFDDEGRLWASEFGSTRFDELNLIRAGGNYGWPMVEGPSDRQDVIAPQAWWSPTSVASPSGIAHADGSIWVATLRGERLYEVPVRDGTAGESTAHVTGELGRLRDVVSAAPGRLWVLTNNTDGRGSPDADDDRLVEVTLE